MGTAASLQRARSRRIDPRIARDLLIWLHVVTSVGWLSQAIGLVALIVFGAAAAAQRVSAYEMAELLDQNVLLHLANWSAFTGLMLCALTPWGYFRYWWVLAKTVITLSQLYVGIAILGPSMSAAVKAAEAGLGAPPLLAPAAVLMISALGLQTWLGVAKPWKRTPWAPPGTIPSAAPVMFLVSVALPLADYALGMLLFARPYPFLILLMAIAYPFWRSRRLRAVNV